MNLQNFVDQMVTLKKEGNTFHVDDNLLEYFNPIDRKKLQKIKKQLERIQKLKFSKEKYHRNYKTKKMFDGRKSYLAGLCFERLISEIFGQSLIFKLDERVVTDSGEIDFFIHIIQPYDIFFKILNGHTKIFGEAKCHYMSPKSEWVNTLVGKMASNSARLGMIFTNFKAGTPPKPFISTIKDHYRSNPPTIIIPWGPTLIESMLEGNSFLKALQIQSNFAFSGTLSLNL